MSSPTVVGRVIAGSQTNELLGRFDHDVIVTQARSSAWSRFTLRGVSGRRVRSPASIGNVIVTVRRLVQTAADVIECESPVGTLIGQWRGRTTPAPGLSADVELDTSGPLVWNDGPAIVHPDGRSEHGQVLHGRIEDIDGDYVAVRVGETLVGLEVRGEPLGALGQPVVIKPAAFSLWPTGI